MTMTIKFPIPSLNPQPEPPGIALNPQPEPPGLLSLLPTLPSDLKRGKSGDMA